MKHPEHEIRSGESMEPVMNGRNAAFQEASPAHLQKWPILLLAMMPILLLNGCASLKSQEIAGPGKYGYPEDIESRVHF